LHAKTAFVSNLVTKITLTFVAALVMMTTVADVSNYKMTAKYDQDDETSATT